LDCRPDGALESTLFARAGKNANGREEELLAACLLISDYDDNPFRSNGIGLRDDLLAMPNPGPHLPLLPADLPPPFARLFHTHDRLTPDL
jgi:hypothetical protein